MGVCLLMTLSKTRHGFRMRKWRNRHDSHAQVVAQSGRPCSWRPASTVVLDHKVPRSFDENHQPRDRPLPQVR